MPINISDIRPVKGATYYVNTEPTPAEVAMFPKPVNFKIVHGDTFRLVSYKENGQRLEILGDKHYRHIQNDPSKRWVITHSLNKKVSVTVVDTANSEMEGEVELNDGNMVILNFNYPFSGEALLN